MPDPLRHSTPPQLRQHLFQKGRAKTGGRKVGSQNKIRAVSAAMKILRPDLHGLELLTEAAVDPFRIMIEVIQDPRCTLELKGKMATELAKYVYVPRKAVEVTGPDGQPFRNKIEIVVTRIDQDISQLPPPPAGGPIIDIQDSKQKE